MDSWPTWPSCPSQWPFDVELLERLLEESYRWAKVAIPLAILRHSRVKLRQQTLPSSGIIDQLYASFGHRSSAPLSACMALNTVCLRISSWEEIESTALSFITDPCLKHVTEIDLFGLGELGTSQLPDNGSSNTLYMHGRWRHITHIYSCAMQWSYRSLAWLLPSARSLISFVSVGDSIDTHYPRMPEPRAIQVPQLRSLEIRGYPMTTSRLMGYLDAPNITQLLIMGPEDPIGHWHSPPTSIDLTKPLLPSPLPLLETYVCHCIPPTEMLEESIPNVQTIELLGAVESLLYIAGLAVRAKKLLPKLQVIRVPNVTLSENLASVDFSDILGDRSTTAYGLMDDTAESAARQPRMSGPTVQIEKLLCTEMAMESLKFQAEKWGISIVIGDWTPLLPYLSYSDFLRQ
ncbi:hypothetical protein FA15DRAFT_655691 [Coprinopsis marcescibilis]|uniref:Uncharacterized protein n=1 Tax=Coprinopsis marcescibilis TaxID=230819 RepID=A0A5C3KVM9_COPMA|nr:hypothetical protein FA15DRAFT_655691 [Coprinopsis marcescibilis]